MATKRQILRTAALTQMYMGLNFSVFENLFEINTEKAIRYAIEFLIQNPQKAHVTASQLSILYFHCKIQTKLLTFFFFFLSQWAHKT